MWVKGGYDIPGLSRQDINRLVEVVENNEKGSLKNTNRNN